MFYLSHAGGEHTARQSSELHRITRTLGDTIVCDELVKAIEGVTTNGKTKLQQG